MTEKSLFSAKGVFLHSPKVENIRQWYEERIILLKAESSAEALRRAEKDAEAYAEDSDDTKFVEITDVFQLYESEIGDKCEVFSSKMISDLKPQEYLETFYPNTPEDCEADGRKHSWHNSDGEYSACYNCLTRRKGKLWENENNNRKTKE